MVTLVKITNQKNHLPFMHHAFNQNKHIFGQCGYLNQVEPFEKPWFVIMWSIHSYTHPIGVMKNTNS